MLPFKVAMCSVLPWLGPHKLRSSRAHNALLQRNRIQNAPANRPLRALCGDGQPRSGRRAQLSVAKPQLCTSDRSRVKGATAPSLLLALQRQ